jgi:hypothetical protein
MSGVDEIKEGDQVRILVDKVGEMTLGVRVEQGVPAAV